MEIPQSELDVIQSQVDHGDENAKVMLDALQSQKAAEKPEATQDKTGIADKQTENAVKTVVKPGEKSEVDQSQEETVKANKPTKLDTIRELRRKRRELEFEMERREAEYQRRLEALEERLKTLPTGEQKPKTESTLLEELLTKPDVVLSERDKRLKEDIIKAIREENQKTRQFEEKQIARIQEGRDASKILKQLDGFDPNDDDAIYNLLEKSYGFDEDHVDKLALTMPVAFAGLVEKAWKTRNVLPSDKVSDKKVATSSAAGNGKTTSGTKLGFSDLNEQYRTAKTNEDRERIWKQLEELDKTG